MYESLVTCVLCMLCFIRYIKRQNPARGPFIAAAICRHWLALGIYLWMKGGALTLLIWINVTDYLTDESVCFFVIQGEARHIFFALETTNQEHHAVSSRPFPIRGFSGCCRHQGWGAEGFESHVLWLAPAAYALPLRFSAPCREEACLRLNKHTPLA